MFLTVNTNTVRVQGSGIQGLHCDKCTYHGKKKKLEDLKTLLMGRKNNVVRAKRHSTEVRVFALLWADSWCGVGVLLCATPDDAQG